MLWPQQRAGGAAASPTVEDETTTALTGAESLLDSAAPPAAAPLWTQESASTCATDYDEDEENNDDDDDNDLAWSQPPSPAWEAATLGDEPWIPSAQPVFYPFSQPASGIRPLTPPSPVVVAVAAGGRPRLDIVGEDDSWASEFETDVEMDKMLNDIMQSISGAAL